MLVSTWLKRSKHKSETHSAAFGRLTVVAQESREMTSAVIGLSTFWGGLGLSWGTFAQNTEQLWKVFTCHFRVYAKRQVEYGSFQHLAIFWNGLGGLFRICLTTSGAALENLQLPFWSIPKVTCKITRLSAPVCNKEFLKNVLDTVCGVDSGVSWGSVDNLRGGFGELLLVTWKHDQSDKQNIAAPSAKMLARVPSSMVWTRFAVDSVVSWDSGGEDTGRL